MGVSLGRRPLYDPAPTIGRSESCADNLQRIRR
ncbi:hypothetical protein SFR_1483 [Streptomyces sp. FR-008]|nr:hypothetical protein SFR_1483 [Streptomyces sp. FR-008]